MSGPTLLEHSINGGREWRALGHVQPDGSLQVCGFLFCFVLFTI